MLYAVIGIILFKSTLVKSQSNCDSITTKQIINSLETCLSNIQACKNGIYKASKPDPGWEPAENGYSYYMTDTLSWNAARNECLKNSGDLAHDGIRSLANRMSILKGNARNVWIGLTDARNESHWEWVDGSLAVDNDIHWAEDEPNDHNGNEDCGFVTYDYKTDDNFCENPRPALCEKET